MTNLPQQAAMLLADVIDIAKQAGDAIMRVYATDFDVATKSDQSPLTQADLSAHHIIEQGLKALKPQFPVLSEESASIDFATRQQWQTYWLVDPLDGTKEFVKRNGEFTVNIALIHQHAPIMGVVYAPALDVLYFASYQQGAFKQVAQQAIQSIQIHALNANKVSVAGSRSHACTQTQAFFQQIAMKLSEPNIISMGSSLKTCLVAEGIADIYPRLGPTSEWDTAAAHCVLNEAGGTIIDCAGHVLAYNTKESLLNPNFLAIADGHHDWIQYLD